MKYTDARRFGTDVKDVLDPEVSDHGCFGTYITTFRDMIKKYKDLGF